jgi:hypothetical protein
MLEIEEALRPVKQGLYLERRRLSSCTDHAAQSGFDGFSRPGRQFSNAQASADVGSAVAGATASTQVLLPSHIGGAELPAKAASLP